MIQIHPIPATETLFSNPEVELWVLHSAGAAVSNADLVAGFQLSEMLLVVTNNVIRPGCTWASALEMKTCKTSLSLDQLSEPHIILHLPY